MPEWLYLTRSVVLRLLPFLDAETQRDAVEATFARFLARGDVGIILINQPIADMIR